MNVLHICANPKPADQSVSKQLSIAFISRLIEKNADIEINNVDLYQDPPPFLSYAAFRGLWQPALDPTYKPAKDEVKASEYATRHSAMFNEADVLVLTMPMWNFGPPAIMKAWFDQVLTPGKTFEFGLAEGGGIEIRPLHKVRREGVAELMQEGACGYARAFGDLLADVQQGTFAHDTSSG